MMRKKYLPLLICSIVLLSDQSIKIWAKLNMSLFEEIPVMGSWLSLMLVENSPMAINMAGGGEAMTTIRLLIAIVVAYLLIKLIKKQKSVLLLSSMALLVAGMFSNLIDAIFYGLMFNNGALFSGKVVDVLYVIPLAEILNIADIAIRLGYLGLALLLIIWLLGKMVRRTHTNQGEIN